MQSGLQLLHAKRAGRLQRRTADERDDPTAEENSKRDGLDRYYRRGADAARGYRGTCRGGAVRMQIQVAAADYKWHAPGSQAENLARGDGTGGEPGRAGGRSDESTFKAGGTAESNGKSGTREGNARQPEADHHQHGDRAMEHRGSGAAAGLVRRARIR